MEHISKSNKNRQQEKRMKEVSKTKMLTKAELTLMNIIWDKGPSTVNDLINALPEPKPAYTTVLTVMQVLTRKQVLTFEKHGKTNVYIPLLAHQEYLNIVMDKIRDHMFQGSAKSFLSFIIKHENISKKEVENIFRLSDDKQTNINNH